MTRMVMSRRHLLGAGACALTGAASSPGVASAHGGVELSAAKEQLIRKWYAAWEQKEWGPIDTLLADNFTFSSAAGDDHIGAGVQAGRDAPRAQVGAGGQRAAEPQLCRARGQVIALDMGELRRDA